ncbi:uncharacterized proline-rich protein-like [Penaeus monodon]|uniref:uncharacterized proline-rich protein-like n=1 Tax=Penaeus monodon TaxID=6687 RepID=UPI0018A7A7C5|nr:uncharacterized proline-rich protein-like [Penaeus monodon]
MCCVYTISCTFFKRHFKGSTPTSPTPSPPPQTPTPNLPLNAQPLSPSPYPPPTTPNAHTKFRPKITIADFYPREPDYLSSITCTRIALVGSRVQGFRGSGVQGFRGLGVQGFRGTEVSYL